MRQFINYTFKSRLLIFLFFLVMFLGVVSLQVLAQKPTVLIDKAIAIKKDSLLLDLKIKRFKSQNLTLELKNMDTKFVQRFSIVKSLMVDEGNDCLIFLRLKFPSGDTQILLFDNQNFPICNSRRQNTEQNAVNYDPSKGNN